MTLVRWIRPSSGCFKLNVDGSSRGSPGDSTVGGVVRDSSGRVVVSFSEFIGVRTNVRAELWTVWRGGAFSFVLIFPSFPFGSRLTLRYLFRFCVPVGVVGVCTILLLRSFCY